MIANSVFEYFVSCQCFVDPLPVFILLDLGFFYLERVTKLCDLVLQLLHHIVLIHSTAETTMINAALTHTEALISVVRFCPSIVWSPNVVKV